MYEKIELNITKTVCLSLNNLVRRVRGSLKWNILRNYT